MYSVVGGKRTIVPLTKSRQVGPTFTHILINLITSENIQMYIEDDVIMLATVLMVVTASGIGIPLRI